MNLFTGRNRDSDMENRCVYMRGWQGAGRMNWASGTDIHKPPCAEQTAGGRLLTVQRAWLGTLRWPEGRDGEAGGSRGKGCMPTYSWFILLCSRNPIGHCKATLLQLKKKTWQTRPMLSWRPSSSRRWQIHEWMRRALLDGSWRLETTRGSGMVTETQTEYWGSCQENCLKKEDFLAETWMRRKSLWGQDLTEGMTEGTPGSTESERRLWVKRSVSVWGTERKPAGPGHHEWARR